MSIASEIVGRMLGLPAPLTRDVVVERDLQVPMDDGAVLLADRWVPRDARADGGGLPTLLVRSPYGRSGPLGVLLGQVWAERGFQAVVQSVRGTFGSGGTFNPFDERDDGLHTLDWLEAQPWHTRGRLGMMGPSYLGLVQWAIARPANGRIGALAPQVTASQFHGQAYGGGGVSLDSAASWLLILGLQEKRLGMLRIPFALRRTLPPLFEELPLGEVGERLGGDAAPYWRDWLEHSSSDDPYWMQRDNSAGIDEVEAPIQLTGGWYDIFLPWQLEDFKALRDAGRSPQLIVGPWAHTAPGLAAHGARAAFAWMRAHLCGDRQLLREDPVQLYVTGASEWRGFADWPPPGAAEQTLWLASGGGLRDSAPSEADPREPARYRYDPSDPTPAVGGPVLMEIAPVSDNRPLESRPDVVTYTGRPLGHAVEAIGPVGVEVFVRASVPWFDVFARVTDVHPDGRSINVCDALVRVTPDDFEHLDDGTVRVRFPLWPTAHRFAAGHRVRLQVSSGAHPRYARNPGTGEPPATAKDLVPVDIEVLQDAEHPSSLTLTVV